MKRLFLLLPIVLCLLSGCRKAADEGPWRQALANLKLKENCSVTETTTQSGKTIIRTRSYEKSASKLTDDEETTYYAAEGSKCFIYVLNDDPAIWVKKELTSSDLYFYDYITLERLNKIGSFIDMGLLTYNPENGCYHGENLNKSYVYRDEVHTPISLSVCIDNGIITGIQETWTGVDADGNACLKFDEVSIGSFSTTRVRLPLDVVNYEDFDNNEEDSPEADS